MAIALHQIADVLDSIETSEELMKDLILDRFNKSTKFVIAALAKFSDQEAASSDRTAGTRSNLFNSNFMGSMAFYQPC